MATINPWKEFQGLLPRPRRMIGTVISDNDNGSSTIELRDGSRMTAEGQGVEVGKKVLVENRVIVRELPDLPIYRVQV